MRVLHEQTRLDVDAALQKAEVHIRSTLKSARESTHEGREHHLNRAIAEINAARKALDLPISGPPATAAK